MKVNARNNIIRKLANSKWGCEYASPAWARSTHASKLNPALKPTNVDNVHLLAGIAPPHIRRTVASCIEHTRQTTDARHQLFNHQPASSRLKSRKSFLRSVAPLDSSPSITRLQMWNDRLADVPASTNMGLEAAESLPAGVRGSKKHGYAGVPWWPFADWRWSCKDHTEEVGLHWWHTISELWQWGAADDGPPPLL